MAISGSNTGQLRPYTARELIEEATSRCGIKSVQLTSEIVEKSLDQLNLMFPALLNRGIQLWRRQRVIMPCYIAQGRIDLPMGVSVAQKVTRRELSRANGGTPFAYAYDGINIDGDASAAFDDDFDTSCSQATASGMIGMMFDQPIQITTVGVKFNTSINLTLYAEYTLDGSEWLTAGAVQGATQYGQWVWFDLDGSRAAIGWRIRSVVPLDITQAPVTLDVQEVFFGHNPSEIVIEPWNLDEYNGMPNKTSPGRVVNYYQQRDLDITGLLVWPVPDASAKYDQLVCWVQEYLDTVSSPTQSLDVPRRWYEAITAQLARRLCRSLPEADLSRYQMLQQEEIQEMSLAEGEERDNSPTNYDMGLQQYTA